MGASARSVTSGKLRRFDQPFGICGWGGKFRLFGDQESVGGDAQCAVMMEARLSPALIMAQSQFLLEFLIVPFDQPA